MKNRPERLETDEGIVIGMFYYGMVAETDYVIMNAAMTRLP